MALFFLLCAGFVFLFVLISVAGGLWITAKTSSFSTKPCRQAYRIIVVHTYSPKTPGFSGWKVKIPKRGKLVAQRAWELAHRLGIPLFLPVGAITVPGSKESEAQIYARYLREKFSVRVELVVSRNSSARDTRTCVEEMCTVAQRTNLKPVLNVATRPHLLRTEKILHELKANARDFDFLAVECSFRYYVWEFWMYVADIHLLRPGSWTRRILLNGMGRKA